MELPSSTSSTFLDTAQAEPNPQSLGLSVVRNLSQLHSHVPVAPELRHWFNKSITPDVGNTPHHTLIGIDQNTSLPPLSPRTTILTSQRNQVRKANHVTVPKQIQVSTSPRVAHSSKASSLAEPDLFLDEEPTFSTSIHSVKYDSPSCQMSSDLSEISKTPIYDGVCKRSSPIDIDKPDAENLPTIPNQNPACGNANRVSSVQTIIGKRKRCSKHPFTPLNHYNRPSAGSSDEPEDGDSTVDITPDSFRRNNDIATGRSSRQGDKEARFRAVREAKELALAEYHNEGANVEEEYQKPAIQRQKVQKNLLQGQENDLLAKDKKATMLASVISTPAGVSTIIATAPVVNYKPASYAPNPVLLRVAHSAGEKGKAPRMARRTPQNAPEAIERRRMMTKQKTAFQTLENLGTAVDFEQAKVAGRQDAILRPQAFVMQGRITKRSTSDLGRSPLDNTGILHPPSNTWQLMPVTSTPTTTPVSGRIMEDSIEVARRQVSGRARSQNSRSQLEKENTPVIEDLRSVSRQSLSRAETHQTDFEPVEPARECAPHARHMVETPRLVGRVEARLHLDVRSDELSTVQQNDVQLAPAETLSSMSPFSSTRQPRNCPEPYSATPSGPDPSPSQQPSQVSLIAVSTPLSPGSFVDIDGITYRLEEQEGHPCYGMLASHPVIQFEEGELLVKFTVITVLTPEMVKLIGGKWHTRTAKGLEPTAGEILKVGDQHYEKSLIYKTMA